MPGLSKDGSGGPATDGPGPGGPGTVAPGSSGPGSGEQGSGEPGSGGQGTAQQVLRRPRPERRRSRRSPQRVAVRAALLSVAAGPVVGLLWWLTSLGGVGGRASTYLELVQSVGDADAGFALAALLAGAVGGVWWVLAREEQHDVRGVARLVGLLAGGLVGAVLAWSTGTLLAVLLPGSVPGIDAAVVEEVSRPRPSLAVVAGCLLWPLGVCVLVAVDTLREVAWQAVFPDRDDDRDDDREAERQR